MSRTPFRSQVLSWERATVEFDVVRISGVAFRLRTWVPASGLAQGEGRAEITSPVTLRERRPAASRPVGEGAGRKLQVCDVGICFFLCRSSLCHSRARLDYSASTSRSPERSRRRIRILLRLAPQGERSPRVPRAVGEGHSCRGLSVLTGSDLGGARRFKIAGGRDQVIVVQARPPSVVELNTPSASIQPSAGVDEAQARTAQSRVLRI